MDFLKEILIKGIPTYTLNKNLLFILMETKKGGEIKWGK